MVEQVPQKNTVSSEIKWKNGRMNSRGECGVSAVKRGWAAAGRAGSHGTSQAFTMQAPPAESVVLLLGNGRPTSKSLVVPTCVMKTYRVPGAMRPAR